MIEDRTARLDGGQRATPPGSRRSHAGRTAPPGKRTATAQRSGRHPHRRADHRRPDPSDCGRQPHAAEILGAAPRTRSIGRTLPPLCVPGGRGMLSDQRSGPDGGPIGTDCAQKRRRQGPRSEDRGACRLARTSVPDRELRGHLLAQTGAGEGPGIAFAARGHPGVHGRRSPGRGWLRPDQELQQAVPGPVAVARTRSFSPETTIRPCSFAMAPTAGSPGASQQNPGVV